MLVHGGEAIVFVASHSALIVLHNPPEKTNGPHFLFILEAKLYQIDVLRARITIFFSVANMAL